EENRRVAWASMTLFLPFLQNLHYLGDIFLPHLFERSVWNICFQLLFMRREIKKSRNGEKVHLRLDFSKQPHPFVQDRGLFLRRAVNIIPQSDLVISPNYLVRAADNYSFDVAHRALT